MTVEQKLNWIKKHCKFAQQVTPPTTPAPVSPPVQPAKMLRVLDTRREWVEGTGGDSWAGDPVIENDDEINCTPDEIDQEEGLTAAHIAAKYIRNNATGALEPSSSSYHQGLWYSSSDSDMRTGDILERSFHLKGFTPEEEQAVFTLVTQRR